MQWPGWRSALLRDYGLRDTCPPRRQRHPQRADETAAAPADALDTSRRTRPLDTSQPALDTSRPAPAPASHQLLEETPAARVQAGHVFVQRALRDRYKRRRDAILRERGDVDAGRLRMLLDVLLFLLPPACIAGSVTAVFAALCLLDSGLRAGWLPAALTGPVAGALVVVAGLQALYMYIQRRSASDAGSTSMYRQQHHGNRFSWPWFVEQGVESGVEFSWWWDESGAAVASRAHYCPGVKRRIALAVVTWGLLLAQLHAVYRWLSPPSAAVAAAAQGAPPATGGSDVAQLQPMWSSLSMAAPTWALAGMMLVGLHASIVPVGWRCITFPRKRLILEVSSAQKRAARSRQQLPAIGRARHTTTMLPLDVPRLQCVVHVVWPLASLALLLMWLHRAFDPATGSLLSYTECIAPWDAAPSGDSGTVRQWTTAALTWVLDPLTRRVEAAMAPLLICCGINLAACLLEFAAMGCARLRTAVRAGGSGGRMTPTTVLGRAVAIAYAARHLLRTIVTCCTVSLAFLRLSDASPLQGTVPWAVVWGPELLAATAVLCTWTATSARLLLASRRHCYPEVYRGMLVAMGVDGWRKRNMIEAM